MMRHLFVLFGLILSPLLVDSDTEPSQARDTGLPQYDYTNMMPQSEIPVNSAPYDPSSTFDYTPTYNQPASGIFNHHHSASGSFAGVGEMPTIRQGGHHHQYFSENNQDVPIVDFGRSTADSVMSTIQGYWDKAKVFDPKKMTTGLWVLAGFLIFLGVVAMFNTILSVFSVGLSLLGGSKGAPILALLAKVFLKPLTAIFGRDALSEFAKLDEATVAKTTEVVDNVARMLRNARSLYEELEL